MAGALGLGASAYVVFYTPPKDGLREDIAEEAGLIREGGLAYTSDGGSNATLENVPLPSLPQPIPSLDTKPTFGNVSSPDARVVLQQQYASLAATLLGNPSLVQSWVELGVLYKVGADYNAAVEAWEYATKLNAEYYLPYANLGDLYAYYLHDAKKAERYFLIALEKNPSIEQVIHQAADFYRNVLHDDARADELMRKIAQ